MKKLNEFNVGGTHSENKLGGIPIGSNNSVEQDETKFGNFVFSNRMKVDKDLIKEFNLPSYIKDKTYADASKAIDNKFKDRNDKASSETKETLLNRLSEAHEYVKMQDALRINSTEMDTSNNQMFLGGMTGQAGGLLQGAGAVGNSIGEGSFAERYNYDPKLKAQYQQMEGIKDGIAGAFGPYGQIFRGIEKAGKNIGTSIGGETGGDVASGILDPLSGQMETFKNKESTGWEKAGVVAAPFLSGVIASYGRKRAENKMAVKNHIINSGAYSNDFAYGGPLNDPKYIPTTDDIIDIPDLNLNLPVTTNAYDTKIPDVNYTPNLTTTVNTPSEPISTKSNINLKPVADWMSNNYGDILKYAPVATNALQLSKLKKPSYESLNRLNNRFKPNYVDERTVQNTVGNELDNTVNALTNTTNGSLGSLRNSLLAAGAMKTNALSKAYMDVNNQNNNQNNIKQQFDLNVDQTNLNQSNLETDINDRNKAAYENNKSKLISQIGTDLGNIGKEEVYKKLARNLYGYTWNGKYYKGPDGDTKTAEEMKLMVDNQNKPNSYGGFLKKY